MVFIKRVTVLAALGLLSSVTNSLSVGDELDKLPVEIRDVIEETIDKNGYDKTKTLIDAMVNELETRVQKESRVDGERLEEMIKSFASLKRAYDDEEEEEAAVPFEEDMVVSFEAEPEQQEHSDLALQFAIEDTDNERYFYPVEEESTFGFEEGDVLSAEMDAVFSNAFAEVDESAAKFEAEDAAAAGLENNFLKETEADEKKAEEDLLDMDLAIENIPDVNIRNSIKDKMDEMQYDDAESDLKKYIHEYISNVASDNGEAVNNEEKIMSYISQGFDKKRGEVPAFEMEDQTEHSELAMSFAGGASDAGERYFQPEKSSMGLEQEVEKEEVVDYDAEISDALKEIVMNQDKIAEVLKTMSGSH